MKKIFKMEEEPNRLLKVKVSVEGNGQFCLRPMSDKKGRRVSKGEYRIRGTEDDFALLLQRFKAKDYETKPESKKQMTYKQMIQNAKNNNSYYVWMWNKNWVSSNKVNKVNR